VEEAFSGHKPWREGRSQLDLMIARRHDQRVKDEGERAAEDYPQDMVPGGQTEEKKGL